MKLTSSIKSSLSAVQRYQYKTVLFISVLWTVIDILYWIHYMHLPSDARNDSTFVVLNNEAIVLRIIIVWGMSLLMSYILIFRLRLLLRDHPLALNLLIKTALLVITSFFMNFLLHVTYSVFVIGISLWQSLYNFYRDSMSGLWVFSHSVGWIILFVITQLGIELNEKYSPGVFFDILLGRYINPRVENRIVMFLDLTDSTPIAEKLGTKRYFSFIRDFIFYVSTALLEYDGRIYQYVGDEIVVSWKYSIRNTRKCILSLVAARKLLHKNANYFKRKYGIMPEFKAGIHVGEVTVGEIGLIKKDLAMSGDTMNTAARIRTSCTELKHPFVASREFVEGATTHWQSKSLGSIELKGKSNEVELFALLL